MTMENFAFREPAEPIVFTAADADPGAHSGCLERPNHLSFR